MTMETDMVGSAIGWVAGLAAPGGPGGGGWCSRTAGSGSARFNACGRLAGRVAWWSVVALELELQITDRTDQAGDQWVLLLEPLIGVIRVAVADGLQGLDHLS